MMIFIVVNILVIAFLTLGCSGYFSVIEWFYLRKFSYANSLSILLWVVAAILILMSVYIPIMMIDSFSLMVPRMFCIVPLVISAILIKLLYGKDISKKIVNIKQLQSNR
jgi:hypothetical protein